IPLKLILYLNEIILHDRTNGRTGRKEKLYDIDLPLIIFICDGFPILICKFKRRYLFSLLVHVDVNKFGIYCSSTFCLPVGTVGGNGFIPLHPVYNFRNNYDPKNKNDQANSYV